MEQRRNKTELKRARMYTFLTTELLPVNLYSVENLVLTI